MKQYYSTSFGDPKVSARDPVEKHLLRGKKYRYFFKVFILFFFFKTCKFETPIFLKSETSNDLKSLISNNNVFFIKLLFVRLANEKNGRLMEKLELVQ